MLRADGNTGLEGTCLHTLTRGGKSQRTADELHSSPLGECVCSEISQELLRNRKIL